MKNFDLTKRNSDVITPPVPVRAQLIEPKGPRLSLVPIAGRIFTTSPDEGREESGMVGGIHMPPGSTVGQDFHAIVTVESIGPDCKTVKPGNRILILRGACNQVVHDGHSYWYTEEHAILGILK